MNVAVIKMCNDRPFYARSRGLKVVVAIDDSPHSSRLIEAVSHRKWPEHTEFKILAVLEPIECCVDADEWQETMTAANAKRKHAAEDYCQHARQKLMDKVTPASVHFEIRLGDPKEEIVSAASQWHADKIMMGAHSKGVCPHNLLGSVSRAVSQNAP